MDSHRRAVPAVPAVAASVGGGQAASSSTSSSSARSSHRSDIRPILSDLGSDGGNFPRVTIPASVDELETPFWFSEVLGEPDTAVDVSTRTPAPRVGPESA